MGSHRNGSNEKSRVLVSGAVLLPLKVISCCTTREICDMLLAALTGGFEFEFCGAPLVTSRMDGWIDR